MQRKLRDYFAAGVRLVWYIDLRSRLAWAYTAIDKGQSLTEADVLDGGEVLPGFLLPLSKLFAELEL
jgi:Uma2 family endonuclease